MTKELLNKMLSSTISMSGVAPDDVATVLSGIIIAQHAMRPFTDKGINMVKAAAEVIAVKAHE